MIMCREIHAENGLVSMDEDRVRAMLHAPLISRRYYWRDREPGSLEAIIMIVMTNFWSSNDTHLEELFSYVRRPFRTRRLNKANEFKVIHKPHAEALIHFAKDCSDRIGVPLVIGIITNKRNGRKSQAVSVGIGLSSWGLFRHQSEVDRWGRSDQ